MNVFVLPETPRQTSRRRQVSGAEDADTAPEPCFSFHMSLQSWLNIRGDIDNTLGDILPPRDACKSSIFSPRAS